MTFEAFKDSLAAQQPPASLSVYAQALWYDGRNNWQQAHDLIQDLPDKKAAWIHAYLHRREGDTWNADYWYNRAGQKRPQVSLQVEWEQLVTHFL